MPLLHELACRIWRAYYPALIGREQVEYMLGWRFAHEAIRCELNNGVVWELIYCEEKPVGFLSYAIEPETRKLKLHKLYVEVGLH